MPPLKKKVAPKTQQAKKHTIVITDANKPIKIVLELVVKISADNTISASLLGGGKPIISYEFEREQITIISLTIEGKTTSNPGLKGDVELNAIPIDGKISVRAKALGQGRGSLQLTFEQKKLFNEPTEFNFSNGTGSIDETVNIPA